MARTGVPSIILLARKIARKYKGRAIALLETETNPTFAAAVVALVLAVEAFEALDDYPFEVDPTDPEA